jgi:hypothetical protein
MSYELAVLVPCLIITASLYLGILIPLVLANFKKLILLSPTHWAIPAAYVWSLSVNDN